MSQRLRLLLIEDNRDDAELLLRHLADLGLEVECHRVFHPESLREALGRRCWDAVICDHTLPGFSGVDALRMFQESGMDIPFLFVSGTIGEEVAVACMRAGAHDYLMKDNLTRLVPALRRELQEARLRLAHKEAETRNRQIVEQAGDGIFLTDVAGALTFANRRMGEILGCSPASLLGRPLEELVLPEDVGLLAHSGSEAFALRFYGPKEHPVWGMLSLSHVDGADGSVHGRLGIVTDVTRLKELETQLLHSQKMEAIGRLAGGVAHDFNNLLSVIVGFTELALHDVPPELAVRSSLEEVLNAARRGAALTRQLLIVGRRQVSWPGPLGLNDAVGEVQRMLARVLGPDVQLEVDLQAQPDRIALDSNALSQVLLNLVINANDAMPEGGTIHLRTYNRHGNVVLAVADEGHGMSAEVRSRIFEPFYTTKEEGKGTGLGLSTVFGIMQQSRGKIEVETSPGDGTVFLMSWPQAAEWRPAPAVPRSQPRPSESKRTVLVVDDTESVRRVLSFMLARGGYQVLQAGSGQEALELEAALKGNLDLLVVDVMMPGIKGPELARQLKARRPQLKVLLTSGYGNSLEDVDQGDGFLDKPVDSHKLLEKVAAALESAPPSPPVRG